MMLGPRERRCVAIASILLITAGSTAGLGGCDGYTPPPSENLEIRDWYDLNAIRDNLRGNHVLMNDLDSITPGYEEMASPTANEGKGWQPIELVSRTGLYFYFGGTFYGQGHEIRDLFINRPDENGVALFSATASDAVVEDIGVANVTVTGKGFVGVLVGSNSGAVIDSRVSGNVIGEERVGGVAGSCGGSVFNCYASANVTGISSVGGLVGRTSGATIQDSYCTGNVIGTDDVGGLVGWNQYGTVSDCHSTGNVTGVDNVGGVVGENGGTVSDSYSDGTVTGDECVGGVVGDNLGALSAVSNCFSTGNVTGNVYVGGLIGLNEDYATLNKSYSIATVSGLPGSGFTGGAVGQNDYGIVSNCYFNGSVTGWGDVGGLVGRNHIGTIGNSYSSGDVSGWGDVGGLVGSMSAGWESNSFWDTEASGQPTSAVGVGKNTTEMQNIATFSDAGWNIIAVALNEANPAYIWNIVNNVTYPFLSWKSWK
jgi:hypothetical protein